MPRYTPGRVWFKGSSTSSSSTSTRSHESSLSSHSSHTQYTNVTSYSDTKPVVKYSSNYQEYEVTDESSSYEDEKDVDPRASIETYASGASTDASEQESSKPPSIYPLMRSVCYHPDAIATTPPEFGELFPSTRRFLIQHDDTTPDGNLNLRLDTELTVSKGQKLKLTLFHLRMYDLAERQFSLRRYQRQSGREVCNTKRKYLKPVTKGSSSPKKRSLSSTFNRMNLKSLAAKPRPKTSYEAEDDDSEDDLEFFAAHADVKATIPTNTVRLEFSNYAQVELERCRRGDGKMYDFEYWGGRYTWRRNVYQDESEMVFSFECVNLATGACVAHVTPDKLSPKQIRREAAQGSWVPPCSMRITEKQMSSDLADVIVATGLVTLTDDCIRRKWPEAHRS
ncbi:uncharacterized protein Z518_08808 [Rhinocladiella mackenziei CBS 650.93]|uniref:Uncharacterized protein n=1 Tax=Rhinocladiella mackenziei CBS 650.93 TaxID=1442369 RepID=A0A0D2J1U3_9EURO|nr:uncharacterized protein Z518_08808 [Rhinocladiella mackenziei CBS 650.93]KIX02865.1 hypothetical protein Z518_08808 [Rhinocladiella mackenziei CBS 650.93]